MFEQTTRLMSESLARAVNRRTFLKRTSQAFFVGALSLAAGHGLAGRAGAQGGPKPPDPTPNCAPPGPYCNTGGGILTGCHGAHCFEHLYNGQVIQCRVYYAFYQTGCWTSGSGSSAWTCCDCSCGTPQQTTCGCAQMAGAPAPLPSRPGSPVGV
jgi:hypothetical protein